MKRIYLIFWLLSAVIGTSLAQPSWVKKATKGVFTLKTFAENGDLIGSATGFYVTAQGEALSNYTPFRGAWKAIIVDADGKELPVECLLGANETYDVAKFRVGNAKKVQPLVVSQGSLAVGASAWLLPYRETKNVPMATIEKAEKFHTEYDYYTVSVTMPQDAVGSPLLNEAGEVVGMMQMPAKQGDKQNYAVSARYADSLRMSGLSINDPVLRATKVKKDLPEAVDQAVLTLYLASQTLDSVANGQLIEDFISKFPDAPDGYQYRAQIAYQANDFAAAQRDMETAIKVAGKKDEAHYSYSRLIYQKELLKKDIPYEPWTLEKALQETDEAYSIASLPIYLHQRALILFAQKKYDEASQVYAELTGSSLRSPELFYEASRCKEMVADTLGQLALLDSAMTMFNRPLLKEAAPYLLMRAQVLLAMERYRDAVADLNDYESLMKTQVNDHFYYIRFQADRGGRLFQQALDDINQAISLNPQYDLYHAEKASLLIRVGLYDDALVTAQECIRLAPEYSDGYLFLGFAQCLKGQKEEGLKNLQKAKELGDPQADGLIEKYK